jgi:integrase
MHEYRIGRLNGRFVVTWDEDGKRRRFRLRAATAGEAHSEARGLLLAAEAARPEGMTVAQIWAAYRDDRAGRSIAESMIHTGKSVLPWFGHFLPSQITTADCRAYVADRRAAGRQDGTIWSQLGHLRNALSWAQKRGLIARAPYIERPAQPAPKERWLTHDEIDRLLAAEAEPHVRLAILLMLTTAARVGAALELTWDRVDLEKGWVNLRTSEGRRKGRAIVPINGTLRAALTTAKDAALSDFVIEWAGGPVKSIKRGFNQTVKRSGIARCTPHDLRRSAARIMVEGGCPMEKVAQYLGHTNTSVTEKVYGRFSPDHLRGAADLLEFGKMRVVK